MPFTRAMRIEKGFQRPSRTGDSISSPFVTVNASAGAQTITKEMIAGGAGLFTGAAGAVAYTIDSIANLDAAFGNDMDIGDCITFVISNSAAQNATITGVTGCVVSGRAVINNAHALCVLTKTAASTYTLQCL
jgi:hypothetical protein